MANDPIKILVIDDNEDDRLMYRRTLKKSTDIEYVITESADGKSGLAQMQKEEPACILLDYSLPGDDGITILKRIRAHHAFIPVVMLTGQGNENIAVAAMREGAENYITKSAITLETLQRAISVAIEHCTLRRQVHEQRTSLEIFTRALAHDLKEPVRTIKSFLDLFATHETMSQSGQNYFNYIRNAAIRMDTLIDTVFFYTQLDGPKQEIVREICDMNGVLGDVRDNLMELIREREATVTCDPLPKIFANHIQLVQVLQNLICNAIRHCESTPVIHICAEETSEQWVFHVKDNGPGIAQEHHDKVFEPFKRMAHHKVQGAGLGLAICKKIIESHGGKIWYDSEPGAGTTFMFTLAKMMPGVKPGNAAAALISEKHSATPDRQLGTIILVEDNDADIELARIMLIEDAGLECTLLVAHDGFEALTMMHAEIAKNAKVDLLLLDINMPGMGGFELLEHMQAEEALKDIPVIMCTTSSYDKDMENARFLGAKGYMTKPAKLSKLKPIIDEINTIELCPKGNGYALLRAA